MTNLDRLPTKKEYSKTIKIYKSHKLSNGFIRITYANVINENAVSTETTVAIEDFGGALTSMYSRNFLGK